MEAALKLIDDYGDGRAHQRVRDHSFLSVLDTIVQYFEGMLPKLTYIRETAANELKDCLNSHPARKRAFIEFQALLKSANSAKRVETAKAKAVAKSELYAAIEHVLKDDVLESDEERAQSIMTLFEEYLMNNSNTVIPTDD